MAAVAVGCLIVGSLLPLYDMLVGRQVPASTVLAMAFFGVIWGFLPGLLMCLPVTLLGVLVANHLDLRNPVSYALLGCLNGATLSVLFGVFPFLWPQEFTFGTFLVVVSSIAGALAGLTYFNVEKGERRAGKAP
jgi:hypothetical protein